jgi:uncharacterized protein YuzE
LKIVPTYSRDADTAYIAFGDGRDVAQTVAPIEDVAIDLDAEGRIVGIELVSASRRLDPSALADAESDELLGVTQIAEVMGKRKQNVAQHYTRRADFPDPAVELPAGRYWRRGDVEAWLRSQRVDATDVAVAAEWLTMYLCVRQRFVADVRESAEAEGLNWPAVKRAAEVIDVRRQGKGTSASWDLPTGHPWLERRSSKSSKA